MAKQKSIEKPKGMQDILPEDQKYWRYILKKAEGILDYYGFEKLDTPVLEDVDLFMRIPEINGLERTLFTTKTKEDYLALRHDSRIPISRAYIENGMNSRPHPVKLYSLAPVFRNQEVQPAKLRQFNQLTIQTIGDASEIIDAEIIFVAFKLLESIGLDNYYVHINSMGDTSCRQTYIRALKDFYKNKTKKLCSDCRNNLKTNPIRILSCKEEGCKEINKEVPQFVDYLDDECRIHFKHILEFLDEVKVPYILNPLLVPAQDYYTRTVFEFLPEQEDPANEQLPIITGGRFDRIVDALGGSKTPAAGWSLGMERLVALLKEKEVAVPESRPKPKIFLAQLGEMAKRKSLMLFENFRRAGIEAKSSLGRDSIKSQLRIAHRLGVRFTLIFGQKEALDGTIILREMETGVQETIPMEKILDEIKKRLKN